MFHDHEVPVVGMCQAIGGFGASSAWILAEGGSVCCPSARDVRQYFAKAHAELAAQQQKGEVCTVAVQHAIGQQVVITVPCVSIVAHIALVVVVHHTWYMWLCVPLCEWLVLLVFLLQFQVPTKYVH